MSGLNISNIGMTLIFLSVVMSGLPESPFRAFISSLQTLPYLSVLNWFLPVSEMLAILQIWLVAVTAYYVISMLARWVRVIE